MKTIKKIWSILLVCGLILVPTISVSAAEQEPEKVEVSFFNENGEEVSVSEEIADSFMEQLDVDKEVNIVSDKNLRASCTKGILPEVVLNKDEIENIKQFYL